MSHFACIYFEQTNILLPKVKIQPNNYLDTLGYEVKLHKPLEEMREKEWRQLENRLHKYGVEYVLMPLKQNPFQELHQIKGDEIKRYIACYLLDYIYKYKLIQKDKLYASIGIIGGRISETLDITLSLVNEVTDLTFFTDDPTAYEDVLKSIYTSTRLKAKAKVLSRHELAKIDIMFDLEGTKDYAKWCKPQAIYIDMTNHRNKKKRSYEGNPPIIWYDFDIRCGRQLCSLPLLQAILYSQGIYKRSFPLELKRKDIKIARVYTMPLS